MMKEAIDYHDRLAITLIHLDRADEDFLFKQEVTTWQREWPELKAHYVSTGREGRLTAERLRQLIVAEMDIADSLFYVVGPPSMVDSSAKLLDLVGVARKHVKTDRFDGY